ncbi:hypothetical protein MKX01_020335, partial [Papaver californicum]
MKGALIRTLIPISYKTWKQVPQTYKEDAWNELQTSYQFPDSSKVSVVKGMSDPWRRLKYELRIKYYDPYTTYEERILYTPPNVKEKDWRKLCRNEDNDVAQKGRADNKRKRERYDYTHTSGRKPYSLVKDELDDLKQAQVEIKEKQDAGTPVDEVDPLNLAFGKDTRGRVRSVGAFSRKQYDYSAPARAKVVEINSKDEELKHQV